MRQSRQSRIYLSWDSVRVDDVLELVERRDARSPRRVAGVVERIDDGAVDAVPVRIVTFTDNPNSYWSHEWGIAAIHR